MIYSIFRLVNPLLEIGYYLETSDPLSEEQLARVRWLVTESFSPGSVGFVSALRGDVTEIGPRLQIETPDSSNAVSMLHAMGIAQAVRFEQTRRQKKNLVTSPSFDPMTEAIYSSKIQSFETSIVPEPVSVIDLLGEGMSSLEAANKTLGLGMDAWDRQYYHNMFVHLIKRNPTTVELSQIGNGNSEHSRHWYFRGKIIVDGQEMSATLFDVVREPLKRIGKANGSLIAFRDNGSAIRGFEVNVLLPRSPGEPSEFRLTRKLIHITCTAETHNHPTGVSPYGGAATGLGGWLRDKQAIGRGSSIGVALAGYCVSNLFFPEYEISGEEVGRDKPSTYASGLQVLHVGSNAVSDYGNEFGIPLTGGFTRTFEQIVNGEWRAWRKPILYVGGIGHIFDEHLAKETPEIGMHIVRIGGPAYPIGVGGGSASSMTQGENTEELDYASVQRGNAEMGNRTSCVIRTCVEMGPKNPISSIHDQGAGGPSNVLTELMEPLGGTVDIRRIVLGDNTMSVREIWIGEYQEGYGLLIRPEKLGVFQSICERERVNCEVLGVIDGSGKIVVKDSKDETFPVDLDLGHILSDMPQKTFVTERLPRKLKKPRIPRTPLGKLIKLVFGLPSVGSKGYLVHKADRSVGGLVAQQQCCGIEQIAIADASVIAQSHFGLTGSVASIGEQPIMMLVDAKAGARMSVGEMLTNMAGVKISRIADIELDKKTQKVLSRANWMWAAKLPGEGALLFDAATAMSDLCIELGIAIDGGKDSLSMAATVCGETVKAPGSLVMIGYAPVPDITKKITPDIKKPGESLLGLIDLGLGKDRLGGSAILQAFNQIGDESPDVDDAVLLRNSFLAVQEMIEERIILSVHDRSDGGLITTVAEMCMASRCGFILNLTYRFSLQRKLFNQELGYVIEFESKDEHRIRTICENFGIPFEAIGRTRKDGACNILSKNRTCVLASTITELRSWWESTSYEFEKLTRNPTCAAEEYRGLCDPKPDAKNPPSYHLTFVPKATDESRDKTQDPRVAIVREEGTNGDKEMVAVCVAAGLNPIDINMQDLLSGKTNLDSVQGIIYPGGFSFKDVLGSAKGWAGVIRFNDQLRAMFDRFYAREDTFSLGVCNGAQAMPLSGRVPLPEIPEKKQPRFIHNTSRKFEDRCSQAEILKSPAILFAGMEGSKLPVWINHGEGQLFFPDEAVRQEVLRLGLAPLAFVDPFGHQTEAYPHNPNGSPGGLTALCSPDGRHLAMMPHPERCFRLWQLPWMPASWQNLEASPWLRMFQNARAWCIEHR